MFNTRGNTYSRGHRYLRSTDTSYWEFSMDELALIDLPTQIDEVLRLTGQPSLALIGHSQGCTLPLMLLAARPEYNEKVWLLQMLGAVTSPARIEAKFLSQQAKTLSSQVRLVGVVGVGPRSVCPCIPPCTCLRQYIHATTATPLPPRPRQLLIDAGIGQFMQNSATAQLISGCSRPESTEWCFNFISFLFYGSSDYMNSKDLFKVGSTWPSTVALRNLLHWSQLYRSGDGLRMFDFGSNCGVPARGPAPYHESCNLAKYGADLPPSYDLKGVTAKAAVFSGGRQGRAARGGRGEGARPRRRCRAGGPFLGPWVAAVNPAASAPSDAARPRASAIPSHPQLLLEDYTPTRRHRRQHLAQEPDGADAQFLECRRGVQPDLPRACVSH
jgi:pimeloyl-ACP methyl ester carboxylesterase